MKFKRKEVIRIVLSTLVKSLPEKEWKPLERVDMIKYFLGESTHVWTDSFDHGTKLKAKIRPEGLFICGVNVTDSFDWVDPDRENVCHIYVGSVRFFAEFSDMIAQMEIDELS
jgi:hypothetical protein